MILIHCDAKLMMCTCCFDWITYLANKFYRVQNWSNISFNTRHPMTMYHFEKSVRLNFMKIDFSTFNQTLHYLHWCGFNFFLFLQMSIVRDISTVYSWVNVPCALEFLKLELFAGERYMHLHISHNCTISSRFVELIIGCHELRICTYSSKCTIYVCTGNS